MVGRKFKTKEIVLGLATLVIVILVVTFYIWHQVESVRLGYEINRLENEIAALEKEVKNLEAHKSELLSLDLVEKRAKRELGLQTAREDQILRRPRRQKPKQDPGGRQ
jgi:cell division protein FtsL